MTRPDKPSQPDQDLHAETDSSRDQGHETLSEPEWREWVEFEPQPDPISQPQTIKLQPEYERDHSQHGSHQLESVNPTKPHQVVQSDELPVASGWPYPGASPDQLNPRTPIEPAHDAAQADRSHHPVNPGCSAPPHLTAAQAQQRKRSVAPPDDGFRTIDQHSNDYGHDQAQSDHLADSHDRPEHGLTKGTVPGAAETAAPQAGYERRGQNPITRSNRRFDRLTHWNRNLGLTILVIVAAGCAAVGYFAGHLDGDISPTVTSEFLPPEGFSVPGQAHSEFKTHIPLSHEISVLTDPGGEKLRQDNQRNFVFRLKTEDPGQQIQSLGHDDIQHWNRFFENVMLHPPAAATNGEKSDASQAVFGAQQGSELSGDSGVNLSPSAPQTMDIELVNTDVMRSNDPAVSAGFRAHHTKIDSALMARDLVHPATINVSLVSRIQELENQVKKLARELSNLQHAQSQADPSLLSEQPLTFGDDDWTYSEGEAVVGPGETTPSVTPTAAETVPGSQLPVTMTGKSLHAPLHRVQIGDQIKGYGTVTDIVHIDGGGRMLVTEDGAVYVN